MTFKEVKNDLLSFFGWFSTKTLGPILAVLLVLGAVVLLLMGVKGLQIGGLLGKLLGKSEPSRPIDVVNSVDPDRVDKDGKLIQPGTPDSQGQTQAIVVPIETPGLLSDPKTVRFTPPGETKPIEIKLPDGVSNKDVDTVVVVKPEVYAVTVKDSSGITTQKLDDLIAKLGA